MEIYKLDNNDEYKNITGIDELTISKFSDFKGQKLIENWNRPQFDLLENITKVKSEKNNEKSKNLNFDIRCYGNILIVKSKCLEIFTAIDIEILPVKINSINEDFSFFNVLTILEAINFKNMDYKQSMEMLKNNNINFTKDSISENPIFRDKKIVNFYYCTNYFKKIVEENGLKGLEFNKIGTAN